MKKFGLIKYFALSFVILSILIVAGCGEKEEVSNSDSDSNSNGENEKFIFSLGHVASQDHPWHVAALQFAEAVEQDSDGQIVIEVHDSGKLGEETEMLQQMQLGDLEMAIVSGGSHSSIVPEMAVEEMPFVFEDHEQAYKIMDGELGEILFGKLEEQGILGLAYWEDGFFQISNSKGPILEPADFEGLKFRVPEIEMRVDIFKALNANPVPMAFTELFTALQQGVVDGQTNSLPIIESSKFYEVQDYVSVLNVHWGSGILEISSDVWQSLPENLQDVIQENAIKYRDVERKLSQEQNEESLKALEEQGVEINHIANRELFIEAVQPVYEKYEEKFGEEIMNLLVPKD